MSRRAGLVLATLLATGLTSSGCGPSAVDTTYGKSRGSSINGTGVLAELLRQRGHEVRAAVRLNETLSDWADVLVRFSPHPGPPDLEEGRWMLDWLKARTARKLVYVVRDFDAEPEFWTRVIDAQPKDASAEALSRLRANLNQSKTWWTELPSRPKNPAKPADWFAVEPRPPLPLACKTLEGPWAEGVDAGPSAVSRHEGFQVEADEQPVLLRGDGSPLVIAWTLENGSRVLALANPSFLLNAALLNRARRPLTARVVDWVGPDLHHVAMVEGEEVLAEDDPNAMPATSPFRLFQVAPFGRVSAHVLAFLLVLAMASAVRLGRPLPEPSSGVERPSAHPEALGVLLARTGRADAALALLETYRRWRHPSTPPSPRS